MWQPDGITDQILDAQAPGLASDAIGPVNQRPVTAQIVDGRHVLAEQRAQPLVMILTVEFSIAKEGRNALPRNRAGGMQGKVAFQRAAITEQNRRVMTREAPAGDVP